MDGETTLANRQQQHLNSTIAQISAAYNFSEEFGLQLNVPYIHRSFRRVAGSNIESGVLSGLGDITVNGRYTPIARSSEDGNFFWNLQLGLKLPTGSSSALQDEASHLHGGGHGEHDQKRIRPHHHQVRQRPADPHGPKRCESCSPRAVFDVTAE